MTQKKIGSLTMSAAHMARLHKINHRFQRGDEQQMAQMRGQQTMVNNFMPTSKNEPAEADKQWMNFQKYESP